MIDRLPHGIYKDNSFDFACWDSIDYVVFAGSPAWWQCRSTPADVIDSISNHSFVNTFGRLINVSRSFVTDQIHSGIQKYGKRCAFLGIGSHKNAINLDKKVRRTLSHSTDLVVVRDKKTFDLLSRDYKPILIPCPALFSSSFEKNVTSLKSMLFILQGKNVKMKYDGLPEDILKYSLEQFDKVKRHFADVRLACFTWQDYKRLAAMLPGEKIIYNFRAESWPQIIADFDLVISTRVHGCGLSSSLGIPNIMINKGFRTDTTELFESVIVNKADDIADTVDSINLEQISTKLNSHKSHSKEQWVRLVREKLPHLLSS
jgi:hypothetical protein